MTWTSLGETVFRLVERKQTHTTEFQSLLVFYGRDKLMKLYKEEKEKRKPKEDPQLNDNDADRGE